MKLKTFRAPTMPQALALVKRHMGSDAVIVQTRTYKRGGIFGLGCKSIVEITARPTRPDDRVKKPAPVANRLQRLYTAGTTPQENDRVGADRFRDSVSMPMSVMDKPDDSGVRAAIALSGTDEHVKSELVLLRQLVENLVKEQRQLHEPRMPEQLFELYLDLIQREVADEIARDLIEKINGNITDQQCNCIDLVRQRLIEEIDKMISTTGPICNNVNGTARVVALIGPTGVGKTTTIAKIAANLKLRQNKKVGFITIDTYRIGAIDQLRMYAQIIDVPVKVVLTPNELREAVDSMRDFDVVLIDTAGRCQNDQLKLTELKTFMKAAQPHEIHLVLSGTTHHSHMISAAEKFKTIGVDRIILTKLDEAISFGVILSVMRKIDASISYITTGQDVPDDIEVGNGRRLARMLLGMHETKLQTAQSS
ncbi:MAG: flagellar biosynthesis protein FlhF [Sedimentisphaerales bacterium]|nr:flagellar biosynthesis protein FlhF [Sedimentisphaerales bacterium]